MKIIMKKQKKINNYIKLIFLCLFFVSSVHCVEAADISTNQHLVTKSTQQKTINGINDNFYNIDYDSIDYVPNENRGKIAVWDPWEKMNRGIFSFNLFITKNILHPFYYKFYIKVTTPEIRKSFYNIIENCEMPMNFANHVLQLDFVNATKSLYSFFVNSTMGLFGIFNVSDRLGIDASSTNLGITLAKYKVPAGPYIVLPFLGANDLRGTIAKGGTFVVDPFEYNIFKIGGRRDIFSNWWYWTEGSLFVLDNTSYLMDNFYDLMEASFDPYIMMRDAYGQSQSYRINKSKGK
jgi:phospholipid-binding lipoprotein MlaA